MNISPNSIVYRDMTSNQVAELYDDTITIPNLYTLLQKNRELAQIIKEKLQPISDLAYGHEAIQKLDIYTPRSTKNMPVLVDIHGGGWVAGSKNARSIPAEIIMSQGIIWVPIDYGLAPTYQMDEMINHIRTALRWVYNNISQYGGDPNCIYISGQSAGAHLAATAIMPDWHEVFGLPENLIKGLIALSGIYDLGSLLVSKTETQESLKLTAADLKRFSPIYQPPKKNIPTILAYGEKEPFAYQSEAKHYAKILENSGCDVSLIKVPNANHFDMINELGKNQGVLFKVVMELMAKQSLIKN